MAVCWAVIPGADVFLTQDRNWVKFYDLAKQNAKNFNLSSRFRPPPVKEALSGLYPVPARALGSVYQGAQMESHWEDLAFPLYDALAVRLQEEGIRPDTVLVLLTDREGFSPTHKQFPDCPFWDDTVGVEGILCKYFFERTGVRPIFCRLIAATPEKLHSGEEMLTQIYRYLYAYESETTILSASTAPPVIQAAATLTVAKYFRPAKLLVSGRKWHYKTELFGELIDVP